MTTVTRKSLKHKIKYVMLVIVSFLAVLLLAVLVLLWGWSPGKPRPFLDAKGKPLRGSIAEKIYCDINGSKQGMFLKGKDASRPVLLYVHGGMPDYFLTQNYPTGLEDDFVVVWWEQRGAGLSYQSTQPPDSITPEQLVSDLIAVTNYLRQRFGQEKIYLMGHSGGTFLAVQAAAKAPQLYHAYIGMAQMANQLQSEKRAYDYMLERFRANGNRKMVRKLEAAPVTLTGGVPTQYLALRDEAMHSLGIGTMRHMRSVLTGIFLPSWQFREYTLKEKINLWRAKAGAGVSIVWSRMLATDLNEAVPELCIPVYFLEGVYDYTCSYEEAKTYYHRLRALVKAFYTFRESAHSPLFEEPVKVQQILKQDVLAGLTRLADKAE